MQTITRNTLKLTLLLALVLALFGGPSLRAQAATLPPSSACTGSGTVTCDLWAKAGSYTPPGGVATVIWGYTDAQAAALSVPGGPVLVVNQGDTVTVTLHNGLGEATALLFQGQAMPPDTSAGAAPGGSKSYTFTAADPGTYLYEAGLAPGSQHQVAMGLYGALVVRPSSSPTQVYASSASAFDEEALLVLSELDPALNNSASPAVFDMRKYAPQYFLINGKAYPATAAISVTAGNRVAMRYVNAGLQVHSMTALGLSQKIVGQDGVGYAIGHTVAAESIATGQTLDTIAVIPASAALGTQYVVYDANMQLHNSNTAGIGGMLVLLSVGNGAPPPPPGDTTGPAVSGLGLSPNPTNGSVNVTVTASISDVASGGSNVAAAQFYVDSTAGAATSMVAVDAAFDSPTEAVTGTIPSALLSTLSSGNHTVYVRGQDAAGNWGSFLSIILNLDKTGPGTSALALSPNPSSGAVSVVLTGTGSDAASGGSNVTAAEYWVDGGAHVAMTVGPAAPVNSLSATIPAGLAQGTHVVSVRSQDAFGNWGAAATINLIVTDTTPPVTSAVSAAPNPNNGANPLNTTVQAVRVSASFSDAATGGSNIATAEGFIDTVGTTGTGFVFVATDGSFNSPSETGYADVPLVVINALTSGNHTIYVHAKDAAGNWGAAATVTLVIERQPPVASAVTLTPPASNNTAVIVSAAANDTATGNSNIAGGEYFIDTAGAAGTGAVMSPAAAAPSTTISASIPAATVAALTAGNHTIYVRAKDAAGNWSAAVSGTLLIDRTPPTFSSITLTPNAIPTGTVSISLTVNGASDGAGGSGVVGGEYWFGSTNITPGTGTAFTGTSGISIPTASLVAGSYTVRVRIRDAAGNWSTGTNGVRTAALTVTAPVPDAIFSDGFESPTTLPGNWSSVSTTTTSRLNNTTTAALVGTRGLQAQGNNTNYVQFNFGTVANPASATFDARFYFNPNGNTGTNQDIFVARTTGGTTVFRVRYRWNGGAPQVQIQVGTGTSNAAWTAITNGASNRIEVVWQSGGTLQLFVGASIVADQSLTATSTTVGGLRMGSVTSGGSATLEYFDAFSAKRSVSPLFGP